MQWLLLAEWGCSTQATWWLMQGKEKNLIITSVSWLTLVYCYYFVPSNDICYCVNPIQRGEHILAKDNKIEYQKKRTFLDYRDTSVRGTFVVRLTFE